jgi:hypothetical protein
VPAVTLQGTKVAKSSGVIGTSIHDTTRLLRYNLHYSADRKRCIPSIKSGEKSATVKN